MKKYCLVSLILSAGLLFAGPVLAGGLYLSEQATPLSVGTAGVAGVTNTISADAVATNPAGMTDVGNDHVLGGVQLLMTSAKFDPQSASAGGDDGGDAGTVMVIPSMFVVKALNNKWSTGFGVSVPMGGGIDYGDDFVGRYQAQKSELAVVSVTPAVAYKVNDRLSLGASVSALYTSLTLHTAINQPLLPQDGKLKMDELDDWGYQGALGVTYRATDKLTLGATYRTEADTEVEGDLKFENVSSPPLNQLTSQLNQAKVDFTYPQMLQVGAKYQLSDRTLLMADASFEEWSTFGATRIGLSGDSSVVQSFDRDWDDTWHLGFAFAHKLSDEKRAITAGIGYDSSCVDDSKRTADLPVDEQLRFSAAYGQTVSDQLGFALGGTFVWMGDGKIDQTAQNVDFSGEFSTNHMIILSATLNYAY